MPDTTADLVEPFRSKVEQLLRSAGGRVTLTSGRRTYQEQVALRIRNGCPDIYTSPATACRVPTARPGESKHELGLAADFGGDLALAARLAPLVGLKRTVPGEPWHFEAGTGTAAGEAGRAGVVDRVAAVGSDGGIVDDVITGLRNLAVQGLILTGAAALVIAGGYRAVTGRKISADVAKTAKTIATKGAL